MPVHAQAAHLDHDGNRVTDSAYLVAPDAEVAPGVLVLGSWFGLGAATKAICEQLADAGYVALAPDLVGESRTTDDPVEARSWLAERSMDEVADLVVSSAALLRDSSVTPDRPVGVLGLQMGASWALWLASRHPTLVGAVSFFYGIQDVDHLDITCPVQGHFAAVDDLVDDDAKTLLSAALHLECSEVACFDYDATRSGFLEAGPNHDPAAAELAWQRTLAWFDEHLHR
ncbi:MAG: dienelactone hydrolase family protein [Actinobacteria bacterium]|nr:dienelactone hydrolase family protein [Actinomycetota bacterium]